MDLSPQQQSKLKEFADKYGIRFIVLFGSHQSGRARKGSDIDLALYLNGQDGLADDLRRYSDILSNLGGILGVEETRLDLTDLKRAGILLRYEVAVGGKLLYGEELDYLHFKSFAVRDYIDAQDLRQLEDKLVRKRQSLLKGTIGP